MLDYSIKGINPLVPLITTTTPDTYYLKGESTTYPTAMLDFDGNERASVHLRDSDLNTLHILLQELQRMNVSTPERKAAFNEFFAVIDRRRTEWERDLKELQTELAALDRAIQKRTGAYHAVLRHLGIDHDTAMIVATEGTGAETVVVIELDSPVTAEAPRA